MAGQPTKLTPETQKIICDTVSGGGTDRAACLRAGISDRTLLNWKQRGAEGEEPYASFLAAYKKAEGDFILRNAALIGKAAQDGTWQAAAWLLERRYPEEYGRKAVSMEHSGDVKVESGPVLSELISRINSVAARLSAAADTNRSDG